MIWGGGGLQPPKPPPPRSAPVLVYNRFRTGLAQCQIMAIMAKTVACMASSMPNSMWAGDQKHVTMQKHIYHEHRPKSFEAVATTLGINKHFTMHAGTKVTKRVVNTRPKKSKEVQSDRQGTFRNSLIVAGNGGASNSPAPLVSFD